jgi:hypothetical protein
LPLKVIAYFARHLSLKFQLGLFALFFSPAPEDGLEASSFFLAAIFFGGSYLALHRLATI